MLDHAVLRPEVDSRDRDSAATAAVEHLDRTLARRDRRRCLPPRNLHAARVEDAQVGEVAACVRVERPVRHELDRPGTRGAQRSLVAKARGRIRGRCDGGSNNEGDHALPAPERARW